MNRVLHWLIGILMLTATSHCSAADPNWIWSTKDAATKAAPGDVYFRRAFDIGSPSKGSLEITADNRYEVFVNGRNVGSGAQWQSRTKFDISPLLVPGRNIIAVRATSDGEGSAGLVATAAIEQDFGKPAVAVVTDADWKFIVKPLGNWARPDFDDSKWEAAAVLGVYGKTQPWGAAGKVQAPQETPLVNKPRAREKGFFDFRDGDRVVFLGSAFIERMQKEGYLETMITAGLPDKNITFRNLGWSGDTVWGDARGVFGGRADGFKRLLSDVSLCDPTVIIVCYGENEAYAGQAGLEEFRNGLNKLLEALEATGARLLLLSPRQHESLGDPLPDAKEYNEDLKLYRDLIREAALKREHAFIDLSNILPTHSPEEAKYISDNGIHLSPYGELLLASHLLPQLGVRRAESRIFINAENKALDAVGAQVFDLKAEPEGISFSAIWRGVDLPRPHRISLSRQVEFKGLKDLDFRLFVDGEGLAAPNANSWNVRFGVSPISKRHIALLRAIQEKNVLFFNRYRPQNETYLFLFRKHEQGNNAVEIPQFDPLIVEKEKEIAELKKPVAYKFELKVVE